MYMFHFTGYAKSYPFVAENENLYESMKKIKAFALFLQKKKT